MKHREICCDYKKYEFKQSSTSLEIYGTIVFIRHKDAEIILSKIFKNTKWNDLIHADICAHLIY